MSSSRGPHLGVSPPSNSELRLILIGEREAGKSAAGNAILGHKAFDSVGAQTRVSQRRCGVVRGQPLALVDTPGWEWFSPRGAPASSLTARQEMVGGSATLCNPGAHGLLLVVPLAYSFRKRERCIAEEHVALFGPNAWQHTLVLFTISDKRRLQDSTLEDEVEENEDLEMLVEKCGGRFHGLCSWRRKGEDQIGELVAKIQAMVWGNRGAILSTEEILESAEIRDEEEMVQREEERLERAREMRRMREVMRQSEEEEDADDEEDGLEEDTQVDNNEEITNHCNNEPTANTHVSKGGSEKLKRKSSLTSHLDLAKLRFNIRQSCKMQ